MRPWLGAGAVLLATLLPAWADDGQQNVFRAYAIGSGDPEALVEMAGHIVGPDGHVAYDARQQRLLVLTTEARHARIADLFQQAAPMTRNVRIDVSIRGSSARQRSGVSVDAEGGFVREDGIGRTSFRIRPRVEEHSVAVSRDVMQTLLVASGHEGYLRVGEEVPYLSWILDYGRHYDALRQELNWQEVGAFLVVEPTIVGDGPMIRLRLTPELRGMVAGEPQHVRFASVSTEVVVQDGQTFPLGGLSDRSNFYERFLVGGERGGAEEALDISVTPHIMAP